MGLSYPGVMRLRILILLFCIYSASGPAAGQSPASVPLYTCDAQTAFALGCTKVDAGELAAGISDLQVAVAKRPGEAGFALRLAEAYLRAERLDEAEGLLKIIESAATGERTALEFALLRAQLAVLRRDWEAVVRWLAPREARLGIDGMLQWGAALVRMGKSEEAEKVVQRALRRFPQDISLLLESVDIALLRGQFATARQRCAAAAAMGAPRGAVLAREARAWFGLRNVLGTPQLCAVPGGRIGQMTAQGVIFAAGMEEGQCRTAPPESALYAIRAALDAGQDEPADWVLFARCLHAAGQSAAGWSVLDGRMQQLLSEPDAAVLSGAADVALGAGRLEAYLQLIEAAATCSEADAMNVRFEAFKRLAELYNLRGDETMSLAFLKRASELRPEDLSIRLGLADAMWVAGDKVLACDHYRMVLAEGADRAARRRILKRLAEFAELETTAVAQSP